MRHVIAVVAAAFAYVPAPATAFGQTSITEAVHGVVVTDARRILVLRHGTSLVGMAI
jgi:hypothetical protein